MCKIIFVTGSVISSVGKGTSAASINLLLKMRGIKTEMIKFDPYLSDGAGSLSPGQHGNVVVLDDGMECDLDMTHYEALGQATLSKKNIWTSGRIVRELFDDEANNRWGGLTLQTMHISAKIQEKILALSKDVDVVICEIGGTVSDSESWVHYNAIRELKQKIGANNVIIVHVSFIIYLNILKEFKTKPLQVGISNLRSFGLDADILLCRSERPIPDTILDKVSGLTGIQRDNIFGCPDVETIYQIPISFYDKHIDDLIAEIFRFKRNAVKIHKYRDLVEKYISLQEENTITIGLVGKYISTPEAYFTVNEALTHAAMNSGVKVKVKWINSEELENKTNISEYFENVHGIIVPGGFDSRGVEGKIKATNYVRENKLPFLGICLGLQCAIIEISRNLCNLKDANSMEFDKKTSNPVVCYIDGQQEIVKKSGTMRLGSYDCTVKENSLAHELYKKKAVKERHRHRLEANKNYLNELEKVGFSVSGSNPGSNLVEIMELDRKIHPYFIGCQAHIEFKSQVTNPHPLFVGLVKAAIQKKNDSSTGIEKKD